MASISQHIKRHPAPIFSLAYYIDKTLRSCRYIFPIHGHFSTLILAWLPGLVCFVSFVSFVITLGSPYSCCGTSHRQNKNKFDLINWPWRKAGCVVWLVHAFKRDSFVLEPFYIRPQPRTISSSGCLLRRYHLIQIQNEQGRQATNSLSIACYFIRKFNIPIRLCSHESVVI